MVSAECSLPAEEVPVILLKECSWCHEQFPATLEYFYKRAKILQSGKLNLNGTCKRCCQKAYQHIKDPTPRECRGCHAIIPARKHVWYCSPDCKPLATIGGIGARYGRLTVLGLASRINGVIRFRCRCDCGNERDLTNGALTGGLKGGPKGQQSCGCLIVENNAKRRGELHPHWKGGRFKNPDGYILVYAPGHPNTNKSSPYVGEHTLVMSEFLGRPLRKGENCHHKNGKRDDNRLSNLELWGSFQTPGQRVEDIYMWCQDFIRRYRQDMKKFNKVRQENFDDLQLSFIE